jgi:hypothetical protein
VNSTKASFVARLILATTLVTAVTKAARAANQFIKVTNPGWTNSSQSSGTGAWGDYDNDGFLDLFVAELTGNNALYHNLGNANHWLKFRLQGVVANRTAIGAKVRVKTTIGGKTVWQMREVSGGNYCQNDLRLNFGLGDATNVDLVRIEWPSGIVQELSELRANQVLTVTEPVRLEMTKAGELRIRCWKGQAFDMEASTDLSTWTRITSSTNTTGTLIYADPNALQWMRRFYRAVAE